MSFNIDPNAVQRIKAAAQIAAAQQRPNRNRVAVNELLLTERGITVRFSCGGSHQDEPGLVEMNWEQLKGVVS